MVFFFGKRNPESDIIGDNPIILIVDKEHKRFFVEKSKFPEHAIAVARQIKQGNERESTGVADDSKK